MKTIAQDQKDVKGGGGAPNNPWDHLPPIGADAAGEELLAKALFDSLNSDKPGEALISGRHDGREGQIQQQTVYDQVQVPLTKKEHHLTGKMVPRVVRSEWDTKAGAMNQWYATTGVNAHDEEFEREVTWEEARKEGITHRLKMCEETKEVEVPDLEDDGSPKFRTEERPRQHPDGRTVTVAKFVYRDAACRKDMIRPREWGQTCTPPWAEEQLRKTFHHVAAMQDRAAAEKAQAAARKADAAALEAEARRYGLIPAEPRGKVEWLIEGVLCRDMPALWAGPAKCMKTNLGIAAAVALASGKPFLGRFPVARPVPAYYLTGETTLAEAHAIAGHVARSLDVRLEDLPIKWGVALHSLTDTAWLNFLERFLTRTSPGGVFFLDPLNQCLNDVDPANMFKVSPVLQAATRAINRAGNTWVAVHHCKDLRPGSNPPQLGDVAYTAFAQYYRQLLLIGRRRAYASDGNHELALRVIVPAGGGEWALDLDEGNHDGRPRRWEARARPLKEAGVPAGRDEHAQKVLAALGHLARASKPATINGVRDLTSINASNVKAALESLVQDGTVEPYSATVPTGKGARSKVTTCYRIRPSSGQA